MADLPQIASDGHVQVATDGSGKKIDNAELTREPTTQGGTGETVYRQRIVNASDSDPHSVQEVRGEYGRGYALIDSARFDELIEKLDEIATLLKLQLS